MSTEVPSRLVADRDVASFCDAEQLRVVRIVFGIVGDRHVAEDLAQETFVRVYLHWERVQAADSPQAWTARVATNLANSWWRRRYAEGRANRRHGVASEDASDVEPSDRVALERAVAALPRRQRTVISLRYLGGLSVAETATAMRCREGTVKSLTSKAMSQLRDHFGDDDSQTTPRRQSVAVSAQTSPREL